MQQITREGITLCYEEAGEGGPPVLLVHGWCSDHRSMAAIFEHVRAAHRVVAVDLRGHGRSDAPDEAYSIAGFAEDLIWLCNTLGLDQPVVIGHSMGGSIALELAARAPALPSALVTLDGGILLHDALRRACEALLSLLAGADYRESLRAFVAAHLAPVEGSPWRERILDARLQSPQPVIAAVLAAIVRWDGATAARACPVPLLNICPIRPVTDLARFRALCPRLRVAQLPGVSHFLHLEAPSAVIDLIEQFLADVATPARAAA